MKHNLKKVGIFDQKIIEVANVPLNATVLPSLALTVSEPSDRAPCHQAFSKPCLF